VRPCIGFATAREDVGSSEHYSLVAPSAGIAVEPLPFLELRATIAPNALALIDLTGNGSPGAHYYTPVDLALELDLGPRVFVVGSASHYLGSQLSHPLQLGLLGGLRL
jgi:hypothetical protein